MIVDELRKQVDDMLRVNDEMQAEVQRLTAERDQLRARVAELEADRARIADLFHKAQDYRRNYGKGDATQVGKRTIEMCVREFGKVGLGVMEQHIACDVQAYTDQLRAKLTAAADALEWIAPFLRGNGHAVFAEQIESTLAKLRGGQ